ncbi:LacI family transcriptional regulator [Actinotalea sp. M2MS4P-6]|uniref:LacI family DNA-binding transcriptional regulator n=1 Tax=Actinotalea sp. M2MS4P-6 TaxID=2983762 RepID=UPI0021E4B8F3|nr:LacI family DNA-binding transcriptional regulator [Actinotalea sp. M2MS4P-6]MCV2395315.1 LacI family transcriptional regulator [Actinotalea sp. M2MS4P-6]
MATIADVARLAGVAPSTVSYVLSGRRSISDATRLRVESAIAELNYRPHAGARALASARSNTIGLQAPFREGVDVNVIMQFVAGVTSGAHDHDYDVLLVTQGDGSHLARVSASSMIDALVVMDVEDFDARLPALRNLTMPTVLIGLPMETAGLTCIDLDFYQVGLITARHLAERGHRSIALLGSPVEVISRGTSYAIRIDDGFATGATHAATQHVIIPTGASVTGAHAAVDTLVDKHPDVTGIVVHNEVALPHVISRLREHGLAVPDDMSLVAVCPNNVVAAMPLPLTSVEIPAQRIGEMAVEMVVRMIGTDPQTRDNEVRLLAPRLTERGSTRHLEPLGSES